MTELVNLYDFDHKQLISYLTEHDIKSFHAGQIIKWLHRHFVTDIDQMTDLSKSLRKWLKENTTLELPKIALEKPSNDGTIKWLLKLKDGNLIETVFIPEENRGTLCVSSQVGCNLTCSFCSTGTQGFSRNLDASEIIGQVRIACERLLAKKTNQRVTNVVMMGMGEPLLNFDPVISAMSLMIGDLSYGLSKRKVTLSTSGVVPGIYKLKEALPISLAISLHAPNDELRNILVPINKKYPLNILLESLHDYLKVSPHKEIVFEYVMMQEINDSLEQAQELAELLKNMPSKINLIPFNSFPGTDYQRSSNNRIHRFKDLLISKGFIATIRKTRGDDIDAACGQLVGEVKDRTTRQAKFKAKLKDKMQNKVFVKDIKIKA
jgi:23S rRNA (adenine2503-C2)-methyltransferase